MNILCIVTLISSVLVIKSTAQVHYVPAQVLVPIYNGTSFNVSNYPVHNNSVPNYGWNIPGQGNHNFQKPVSSNNGWNYPQNGNQPSYRPYYRNNTNFTTAEGNLLIGTIGLYDRLLFTKEYYKPSRWWSSRDKEIEYPKDIAPSSGYIRHETIAAIRVYNLLYNPTKARAEILAGGVGKQFVKIKLSSNWNNGFKFLVQIYGH